MKESALDNERETGRERAGERRREREREKERGQREVGREGGGERGSERGKEREAEKEVDRGRHMRSKQPTAAHVADCGLRCSSALFAPSRLDAALAHCALQGKVNVFIVSSMVQ